tara:strand:+ start:287 stop:664 length:378 start_codon:yes stop_codon:yes gene_type:complete
MRGQNSKIWTAEELLTACELAREFNYNKKIYPLIATDLERTSQGVRAAVQRVRLGESCFQYNPSKQDSRFLAFMNEDAVVKDYFAPEPLLTPKKEVKEEIKIVHEKVRKRGFSFSIGWGLLKITR